MADVEKFRTTGTITPKKYLRSTSGLLSAKNNMMSNHIFVWLILRDIIVLKGKIFMPITRTKNQHFIAQCILNTFFGDWHIYETLIQKKISYKTTIKKSMMFSNSYEAVYLPDNMLEDFFASSIDGITADYSKTIIKEIENNADFALIKDTIYKGLYYYLVAYYKSLCALIRFGSDLSKLKNDEAIIKMLQRIFDKNYISDLITSMINGYNLCIIKSPNNNFYLGDQFISTASLDFKGHYINSSNREIGMSNIIILIPLTITYYIVLFNGDVSEFSFNPDTIIEIEEETESKINQLILLNSENKIVSKNIMEINTEKDYKSDTASMIGSDNGNHKMYKVKKEIFANQKAQDLYDHWHKLEWGIRKGTPVNEKCPCGSNKKYKKCCKNMDDECQSILYKMHYTNQAHLHASKNGICEMPIELPMSESNNIFNLIKQVNKN